MIVNELQQETDEVEPFEFGTNVSLDRLSTSSSLQQTDTPSDIEDNVSFMEWMNTASIEHKLNPKRKPFQKENSLSSSSQSSIVTIRNYISASSVSHDDFNFPIGNVRTKIYQENYISYKKKKISIVKKTVVQV